MYSKQASYKAWLLLLACWSQLWVAPAAATTTTSPAKLWHSHNPGFEQRHGQHNKRAIKAPSIEETKQALGEDTVWIVELDETSDVLARDELQRRGLDVATHQSIAHQSFSKLMQKAGDNFSIRTEYSDSPNIFHGAAVTLDNQKVADRVAKLAGVKNIWPSRTIHHPARGLAHNELSKRAETSDNNTYNPHVMMGIDYAHQRNLRGKGVLVASVDSGVDYTHPALGGCFGSDCKVSKGYAFVGDDISNSSFVANGDPFANCIGAVHGTMISGIMAADETDTGFVGVAPEAKLAMYRIFDCDLSSKEHLLISGIMKAYSDGADVINLSLGAGIGGFAEDPLSVIVDRIVAEGTFVTVSTGNYGDQGAFYLPAPATAVNALKVGSIEPEALTQFTAITNTNRDINYYGSHSYGKGEFSVFVNTLDTTSTTDGCSALSDDTPNLEGHVAVFRRGGCALVTKALNAAAFNASGVFVYSTEGASIAYDDGITEGYTSGNLALISAEDGAYLVQRAQNGESTTLTFKDHLTNTENTESSGISYFSQYGPTADMRIAPNVLAPGSNILSTAPLDFGAYTIDSGTSFAAPFAAGAAAVLLSARKDQGSAHDPTTLLQQLINSAKPLSNVRALSANRQGGGLLRLDIALMSSTSLDTTFLALNDTNYFQPEQSFTVTNDGNKKASYYVSHLRALTNYSYKRGSIYPRLEPLVYHRAASASFEPAQFELAAGASQEIKVVFTQPPGLPASAFPIYSGYIRVKPSSGPALRVPYLGLDAAAYDLTVIDTGSEALGFDLPALVNADGTVVSADTQFSMANSSYYPYLYYRFTASSRQVYVEVVKASDNDQTQDTYVTVKSSAYVGRNPVSGDYDSNDSTYNYVDWDGTHEDGSYVPNGSYQFRLRALKITGDREKDSDYEVWTSTVFEVARLE